MKSWRRHIVQTLLLILAGILVAAVVLYLRVKDVPRFYDKALVTSLKQLDDSRDELLEKVEQLLRQHGLTHDGSFQKIISDQRALRYDEYEKGELLLKNGFSRI